jgi:hypothetical protein
MRTRNPLAVRRALSIASALLLAATAVVAQNGYAASGAGDCFRPTLDLYSQSPGPTSSTEGDATVKMKFKPPFILEGAATAQGYLDQDSGATAALGVGATSRFWTPTCKGWSYGWSAAGSVVGSLKSQTSSSSHGSALAMCSFAASAQGDLNPAVQDAKTTQSSTSSGGSVSISIGVAPTGASYTTGTTLATTTVTPSTNAAGDANCLHNGPRFNAGPGAETVVVVNLYGYVNAQANGKVASWLPHWSQSSASTSGFCGAAIVQSLFAIDTAGVGYGMDLHPQTGFYREYSKGGDNVPWKGSGWKPPIGPLGEAQGAELVPAPDPAAPPDPSGRTENDPEHKTPTGGPMHKY